MTGIADSASLAMDAISPSIARCFLAALLTARW
jgi:hypothetical protein